MLMKRIMQNRTVLRLNLLTAGWGFIAVGVHISQGRYIFPSIFLYAFALVMIVIALDGRLLKPGKYPLFRVLYVAVLVFLLGLFLLVFRSWYRIQPFLWAMFFIVYWILYAAYIITLIRAQGEPTLEE